MALVRVRCMTSGVVNHGGTVQSYSFGEEIDLDPETAVRLIRDGAVERVGSVVETAAMPPRGEKAVRMTRPVR